MNEIIGPKLEPDQRAMDAIRPAPSLERRRLRSYILMLLIDGALINLAFAFAAFAYEGIWWDPRAMIAAHALLPIYFTIALYNESYGARALDDWIFAIQRALTALIVSAALLNFVAFYTKSNAVYSRVSVTLGLILSVLAIIAVRRMVPVMIERFWGGRTRNRLVIDDGGPKFTLPRSRHVAASELGLDPASHDPYMLDRLGRLLQNQDHVVVSCPGETREDWAHLLKSFAVRGEIVSEPAHRLGALAVDIYDDQKRTTLVVSTGPLGLRSRILKRGFDVAAAGLGLLVLSPLLLVMAVLIKLEDGGPVLFVQRRTGRGNQFFNLLKFRSMGTERLDHDGKRSAGREDDRVTRIGAFMRSTSIDELPQLLNVLRGDMSIVGPRPHALGSRANNKLFWEVDAHYWKRHSLKPGLTGLAQVRGHRGATEVEKDLTDRLQSDLEYIAGWSLVRDIMIVFRTLLVLRHDNAF